MDKHRNFGFWTLYKNSLFMPFLVLIIISLVSQIQSQFVPGNMPQTTGYNQQRNTYQNLQNQQQQYNSNNNNNNHNRYINPAVNYLPQSQLAQNSYNFAIPLPSTAPTTTISTTAFWQPKLYTTVQTTTIPSTRAPFVSSTTIKYIEPPIYMYLDNFKKQSSEGSEVKNSAAASGGGQHGKMDNDIQVVCHKDRMEVTVNFDHPFNGIIYTKGNAQNPRCKFVKPNSGKDRHSFELIVGECGVSYVDQGLKSGGKAYIEALILINSEPGIQEAWDKAKTIQCYWEGNLEQSISSPFSVIPLESNSTRLVFHGDNARVTMEIRRDSVDSKALQEPVGVGELLTVVVQVVNDPDFDLLVRNCIATDSEYRTLKLPLIDAKGCPLKPKLMGGWRKQKSTKGSLAYAHLSAFKFPENSEIALECSVSLCKGPCSECLQFTELQNHQHLEPNNHGSHDDLLPNDIRSSKGNQNHGLSTTAVDPDPDLDYLDEDDLPENSSLFSLDTRSNIKRSNSHKNDQKITSSSTSTRNIGSGVRFSVQRKRNINKRSIQDRKISILPIDSNSSSTSNTSTTTEYHEKDINLRQVLHVFDNDNDELFTLKNSQSNLITSVPTILYIMSIGAFVLVSLLCLIAFFAFMTLFPRKHHHFDFQDQEKYLKKVDHSKS